MRDLIVLTWNLQVLTAKKATVIADDVAKTVARAVSYHSRLDTDLPFVGFFLEVKDQKADVIEMCETFEKAFARCKDLHGDVDFFGFDCGGGAHTSEWIIVFSRGVKIAMSSLDIRLQMSDTIAKDRILAEQKTQEHEAIFDQFNLRSRHSLPELLQPKADNYTFIPQSEEWYRNGVICDVQLPAEEKPVRIASLHAPNPKLTNQKGEQIINAILRAGDIQKVDIMVGDFNYAGTINRERWRDISPIGGTTLKKSNPQELSSRTWDRIVIRRDGLYAGTSGPPFVANLPTGEFFGDRLPARRLTFPTLFQTETISFNPSEVNATPKKDVGFGGLIMMGGDSSKMLFRGFSEQRPPVPDPFRARWGQTEPQNLSQFGNFFRSQTDPRGFDDKLADENPLRPSGMEEGPNVLRDPFVDRSADPITDHAMLAARLTPLSLPEEALKKFSTDIETEAPKETWIPE